MWCAAKSPNVSVTHERFNMFTIPPLALLAILSLGFNEVLLHKLLSWCVLVYTLVDTMYVVAVPHCMPCGSRFITVVLHHMMVVCIVLHPIFHHENLHHTAYCAIVEINTVCITARRVLRWQWLTIAFFATWIVLRLVWNHCLAYYLHTIMLSQQSLPGSNAWCQVVGPFAAEFGSNSFEPNS